MFEKVALAKPRRGGKAEFYSKQLEAWCSDPVDLWNRRYGNREKRTFTPNNSPEAKAKRAIAAVREGLYSRSVQTLESGALCHSDQRSLE